MALYYPLIFYYWKTYLKAFPGGMQDIIFVDKLEKNYINHNLYIHVNCI